MNQATGWTRVLSMVAAGVVLAGAGLTLLSGASKLADIAEFRSTIVAHGVVGESTSGWAAWGVALGELACGSLVVFWMCAARTRWFAGTLLAGVFAALAIYASVLWVKPPAKPAGCGCGWSSRVVVDWKPLAIRNWACAGMLGLCATGMRRSVPRA